MTDTVIYQKLYICDICFIFIDETGVFIIIIFAAKGYWLVQPPLLGRDLLLKRGSRRGPASVQIRTGM